MREPIPMVGNKYGKLTVLEDCNYDDKHRYVVCQCECGTTKEMRADAVRSGRVKTCGVCNRSQDRFISVMGEKFGKLTVIAEPEVCRNRKVTVQCECGNIVTRFLANLKRGQTKTCGCTKWYDHEIGYIYYLVDPETDEIRYVGQSVQKPEVRLAGHVSVATTERWDRLRNCEEKKEWINSMYPERPILVIAEKDVPVDKLDEREQFHISFCLRAGAKLLNIHHAKIGVAV